MSTLPYGKQWVAHDGARAQLRRFARVAPTLPITIAQAARLDVWLADQPAGVDRARARLVILRMAVQYAAQIHVSFPDALDATLSTLMRELIAEKTAARPPTIHVGRNATVTYLPDAEASA